uniref:Uncharacterized protein n=1 Tax=Anguilla anguilla TaxID=7936 RepID=A0A0E9P9V5_ANGAN
MGGLAFGKLGPHSSSGPRFWSRPQISSSPASDPARSASVL